MPRISAFGIPTALNEMSTRPASSITYRRWSSDGPLVERVDLRRLGGSAVGDDLLGDDLDRRQFTPVRKTLAPSRAKACATAPPIPPPAP